MATQSTYHLSPGVAYEVLDGEAVVLHLPSGTYYRLNEVATRTWEALAATGSPAGAMPGILDTFEVDEATLDTDMRTLLDELVERGLLVAHHL